MPGAPLAHWTAQQTSAANTGPGGKSRRRLSGWARCTLTRSYGAPSVSTQPGSAYIAAKHGVVALSHSINMEECQNGIRATALGPGEVATPIIEKRPVPVSPEERARMVQSQDVGDLIRYIACLPPHVRINEVTLAQGF